MKSDSLFAGTFDGRTVLVTGHTGFKGSWLSLWLKALGAKVVGYALEPDTEPNLFGQLGLSRLMDSHIGDIRDLPGFERVLRDTRPEIIFHMAAQPLVRLSYEIPVETFAVNVLGTVHLMDAVRRTDSVRVCQVITTDKCYENREIDYAYREDDRLGGRDPYSASKACAELAVTSYRNSFFPPSEIAKHGVSLSSARAGNVIGGGDWAKDRLIPDCMRALAAGKPILIRNPRSVRPFQNVLEPLSGYLRLAALQLAEPARYAQAFNFGPAEGAGLTSGEVADTAVKAWGSGSWFTPEPAGQAPHEAGLLRLDSSKARELLDWRPVLSPEEGIARSVAWYRAAQEPGFDALSYTQKQIENYCDSARAAGLAWAANGIPLERL